MAFKAITLINSAFDYSTFDYSTFDYSTIYNSAID